MGIRNVNDQGSVWGAAFRNKLVFFMTGKETEAFLKGRYAGTWNCRRIPAHSASNHTYRRQHTTYEVSDKDKGSAFLDLGIPDFTSQFQIKDGAFYVEDSGFAVDMGALDGKLTPKPPGIMYSNMYKQQFKKIL